MLTAWAPGHADRSRTFIAAAASNPPRNTSSWDRAEASTGVSRSREVWIAAAMEV